MEEERPPLAIGVRHSHHAGRGKGNADETRRRRHDDLEAARGFLRLGQAREKQGGEKGEGEAGAHDSDGCV
jgi:hypothetical protein